MDSSLRSQLSISIKSNSKRDQRSFHRNYPCSIFAVRHHIPCQEMNVMALEAPPSPLSGSYQGLLEANRFIYLRIFSSNSYVGLILITYAIADCSPVRFKYAEVTRWVFLGDGYRHQLVQGVRIPKFTSLTLPSIITNWPERGEDTSPSTNMHLFKNSCLHHLLFLLLGFVILSATRPTPDAANMHSDNAQSRLSNTSSSLRRDAIRRSPVARDLFELPNGWVRSFSGFFFVIFSEIRTSRQFGGQALLFFN